MVIVYDVREMGGLYIETQGNGEGKDFHHYPWDPKDPTRVLHSSTVEEIKEDLGIEIRVSYSKDRVTVGVNNPGSISSLNIHKNNELETVVESFSDAGADHLAAAAYVGTHITVQPVQFGYKRVVAFPIPENNIN